MNALHQERRETFTREALYQLQLRPRPHVQPAPQPYTSFSLVHGHTCSFGGSSTHIIDGITHYLSNQSPIGHLLNLPKNQAEKEGPTLLSLGLASFPHAAESISLLLSAGTGLSFFLVLFVFQGGTRTLLFILKIDQFLLSILTQPSFHGTE